MKKWIAKALVQKVLSLLPGAHGWNKWFQKYVTRGYWLTPDLFARKRRHAVEHLEAYQRWHTPSGSVPKTALEIGTGWYPVVPLSLIAAGVDRVYSVDIVWLCTREQLERTLDLFLQEPHLDAAVRARFATVRNQLNRQPLHQSLEDLGIHYLIGDARRLNLPADSVDLIHSNNTFEHIPEPVLEGILSEFERVLRPGGVQTHFVDLTDHFAHFDRSITPYHFLQFSDRAWRWIDNGIQPMNRMRQSDYLRMYERVGIRPVEHTWEPGDLQALARVRRSKRFAAYTAEDAAVTHCRITSTKDSHNPTAL
jgi:hypothetical protein